MIVRRNEAGYLAGTTVRRKSSRTPVSVKGLAYSTALSTAVLASLFGSLTTGALASDCGANGVVVGGTCVLPDYTPEIDENGGQGPYAANNDLNPVTITDNDVVTLTGSGASIAPGQNGGDGSQPLRDFDVTPETADLLDSVILDRGAKNQGVTFTDPITSATRTISTYNTDNFTGELFGDRHRQTFEDVDDEQYIDTRIANVASSGGTLNIELDEAPDINMAVKQSTLFDADGTGGNESVLNWNSSNTIVLHGAAIPDKLPLSVSSSSLAGWPTDVELPGGEIFHIADLADFEAFNDRLIEMVEENALGLGGEASQEDIQARYDDLIRAGANLTSGTIDYNLYLPEEPDDIFEGVGQRTIMRARGENATTRVSSGAELSVKGATGGVQRAEDGAHAVNEGTINNIGQYDSEGLSYFPPSAAVVLTGDSTGSNEGVINSREASVAVSATDSEYVNNGIINQREGTTRGAGGVAIKAVDSDVINNGIVNVGTAASSANASAIGVDIEGGSFTNSEDAEIYIGRGEQSDAASPAADVALNLGGDVVGVNVKGDATVYNDGAITIGSRTQGAVGLKVDGVADGEVDNRGVITIKGATSGKPRENVGYLVRNSGSTGGEADGTIRNSGAIIVDGVNGTGLKVLGSGTDAGVVSTGPITVSGAADPTSGTRNYGVWAEGTGGGKASVDISGELNLLGDGAIGVHARGDSEVNVAADATPSFSDGTDQIGFFIYGGGASINTAQNTFEVATERSTMFRIAEGAQFDGSEYTITASGKDSTAVVGTGTGTVIDTKGAVFNLTGEGATGVLVEGGASGETDETTTFNLAAAGTVAGVADGQKHGLNGAPVGEPDADTRLTNSADVSSGASGATGFISRNEATIDTTGDILLSGADSVGLLAESDGAFVVDTSLIDVNGWGARAEGGDHNSFELTNVQVHGSDGVLEVAAETGSDFIATASELFGRMITGFDAVSNVNLVSSEWWMDADSNVTDLTLDQTNVFFTRDGNAHKTLTVEGDFAGTGSELFMNTYLGADGSASDLLYVMGDTSGSTLISIENTNGIGERTLMDGIMVVEVDGASNGQFLLNSPYVIRGEEVIFQGAWGYTLQHNGVDDEDGNWYLRTQFADGGTIFAPTVDIYQTYPQLLLGFMSTPTLQQRVGNRYWNDPGQPAEQVFCKDPAQNFLCTVTPDQAGYYAGTGGKSIQRNAMWGRIEGSRGSYQPSGSAAYDSELWKLQAGVDGLLLENDKGVLIGGLNGHYGKTSADMDLLIGTGSISTTGYGVGATLTWYGLNGFYVDGQATATWFDSDMDASSIGRIAEGNDAFGYSLSLEMGKRVELADSLWALTPQAQLTYSRVDFDSFTDTIGAPVSLDDGDSLVGRLGIAVERQNSWVDDAGKLRRASVYGIGNLYYEMLGGTQVDVDGEKFSTANDRLWGGVGLGGTYNWNDDRYSVFGEISVNTSLDNFSDSYNYGGNLGVRVNW